MEDPLHGLSELSRAELDEAVGLFCKGLRKSLADAHAQLRKCMAAMREPAAELSDGHSKFQTFKMSSGNVKKFHKGLAERIGETPSRAFPAGY
jgi:hypothetical protein